ncbi:MAG TPA: transglycosylase domain-containing protein [Candidatus Binatia bacterium]|jgi:penicillin-binding protein 1B
MAGGKKKTSTGNGRTARRKSGRRRPRWRTAAFTVAALLLVSLGVYLASLYRDISTLIDQRSAALSSSILSAPHRIRAGDELERSRLLDRLASLSYSQVAAAEAPGQFTKTPALISIYLRGYHQGGIRYEPSLVQVHVQDGKIAQVTDAGGIEAGHPLLEPEVIGRLVPGAPAERVEIRLADQKPYLVSGLLAVEDQYFYWHPGFNPVRIVEAAIQDVRQKRLAQGASTLTQQLGRTFLERRDRSFERKFRELAVAVVLELRLTKDQILERYINDVPMGAYAGAPLEGLPQAARSFFNKDLSQVSPAEAAMLVGMIQAPTSYDPRRHPSLATQRRNVVLGVMRSEGVIDEATYQESVVSPLGLSRPPGLRRAPYFTDYVLSMLRQLPGVTGDLAGLRVFTTLDTEVQAHAAAAVTANLEKLEKDHHELRRSVRPAKLQSSAVVLDAHSGAIRAMVGGRNYSESQFNRAASALRQPGSAFKPIVYLSAFDPERSPVKPVMTLASLLPDELLSYDGWTPENYEHDYQTQVTAVAALSQSLNVPAAYVGSRLGAERIVRTAHELGIPQDLQPLLPISIGAEETTLLDLSGAYQVFANAGARSPVYAIESVIDANDREIYRHEDSPARVVRPDVAYVVTGALETVLQSGTGASASRLGLDVIAAGKTGTTQDYHDAYFVGYTPELVAGVWVGFDTPQSLGLTGAQAALPAWTRIMHDAAATGARDFTVPPGITMARIDPESGGLATAACRRRVTLPFLQGTAPVDECPLHGQGLFGATDASNRDWGGWRKILPVAAARTAPNKPPPIANVFGKIGHFFGSIFHR